MRPPAAVLLAAATACVLAVAGWAGPAQAVGSLPTPTVGPLPGGSVAVPTPTPVVTVPVPVPTLPGGDTSPGTPTSPGPGRDDTGQVGSASDSTSAGGGSGPSDAGTATGTIARAAALEANRRARRAQAATPMVAGTAAAADLLDDEDSAQLLAASQDFLAADQAIAEIASQQRLMADLLQKARAMAGVYRALGLDLVTGQGASEVLLGRYDELRTQRVRIARGAYMTGQPGTDDATVNGIVAALARLGDGSARAELRVGSLVVQRDEVRAAFELVAARYDQTRLRLDRAEGRLGALSAQRSSALRAAQEAQGNDVALHRARLAESGQLGAQIRAASAELERTGSTVQGTGVFARPLEGQVTSPFGMRFHPVLRYTKLHTGTDFAGGSAILAPDDGRVLMTAANPAYGNFTVIDHGILDGLRVTTVYAHQATILVRVGEAVRKGDRIGVVGSTGYSTGPHLHFEVREDGTVVDPANRL